MKHYLNYLIFFTLPFLSPLLLMSQNNTERKITTLNSEEQELYLSDTIKYKFIVDAVNGSASAMALLGEIRYLRKDFYNAKEWWSKAAELGNSKAMYQIGMLYENGQEVEKSHSKALEMYTKAADRGNSDAMVMLGSYYHLGFVVKKNYAKALGYYIKAFHYGDVSKSVLIGDYYYFGWGVEQNYEKAFEWYSISAENGNFNAMDYLANMYKEGKGVKKNKKKAKEWTKRADATLKGLNVKRGN